ncbi:MAG: hypothetical protein AB8H86_01685 [Polyangiales bacterium]
MKPAIRRFIGGTDRLSRVWAVCGCPTEATQVGQTSMNGGVDL